MKSKKPKLKKTKKGLLKDLPCRFFIIGAFILNAVNWLLIITRLNELPENLILKYNIHLGVFLNGEKNKIFYLPLVGFLIIIINIFLAYSLRKSKIYAIRIISASSFLFNIFIIIALAALFYVNKI
jgi:hypothetical protein